MESGSEYHKLLQFFCEKEKPCKEDVFMALCLKTYPSSSYFKKNSISLHTLITKFGNNADSLFPQETRL